MSLMTRKFGEGETLKNEKLTNADPRAVDSKEVPSNAPSSDTGLDPETWDVYIEQASRDEEQFVKAWNLELDTLLLFATLFSAVLTAFVIVSYSNLQPDPSLQALQQILVILQSNQSNSQAGASNQKVDFELSGSAIRVNSFWFAALVVSVSASFLAILAKQWLFSMTNFSLAPTLEMRGRQHQFRFDRRKKWRLTVILSALPILLHISLLLFFAGLIDFLWQINRTVAIVVASLTSVTVFVYVGTHVLSLVQTTCPYRTSVTSVILSFMSAMFRETLIVVYMVIVLLLLWIPILILRCATGIASFNSDDRKRRTETHRISWLSQTSGSPSRLRKSIKLMWTDVASEIDLSSWDTTYIMEHEDQMDAGALAWLVENMPRSDANIAMLIQQLTRYPKLVQHRMRFIGAGTADFLAAHLFKLYKRNPGPYTPEEKASITSESDALIRLLTEAKEDDPDTLISISGAPAHYSEFALSPDIGIPSLVSSGLIVVDAAIEEQDIHIFANMLRLQVLVSSPDWYWRDTRRSVDQFHARLGDAATITALSDETLFTVVNTAIYLSLMPLEPRKDESEGMSSDKWHLRYTAQTLDLLASVILCRHNAHSSLLRQISWHAWFCSMSSGDWRFFDKSNLIPLLTTFRSVSRPLAESLSTTYLDQPALLHVILVLLEPCLYRQTDEPHISPGDAEDRSAFTTALASRYPTFIEKLNILLRTAAPALQHYSLRLLRRIVRISGCMAFYRQGEGDPLSTVDPDSVIRNTLELLQYAFEHLEEIPADDRVAVCRTIFGTACSIAKLQVEANTVQVAESDSQRTEEHDTQHQFGELLSDIVVEKVEFAGSGTKDISPYAAFGVGLETDTKVDDIMLLSTPDLEKNPADITIPKSSRAGSVTAKLKAAPSADAFIFDDDDPGTLARAVASVIQGAGDVPSSTLKIVLSLVALLHREMEDDGFTASILAHLRDPEHAVIAALESLSENVTLNGDVQNALAAIQGTSDSRPLEAAADAGLLV